MREGFSLIFVLTKLPPLYLAFWFVEAPIKLFENLLKILKASEHFLSLTLMIKTFFRPWKNERRKGYYPYAVGIGATVRFLLIIFDLVLLAAILVFGIMFILIFVTLPIIGILFFFLGSVGYELTF